VLEGEESLRRPGAAGRLLPGVEVRLAAYDDSASEAGEVLVRSTESDWLLAAGYVDEDDGQLFDSEGWVHTGDVATVDGDGYYSIVDRRKDMILSGGLNVSSLEVEQVLGRCPGVSEVAVTARPDARYGERVVAWVVSDPAVELSKLSLTEFFVAHAASYKKPREIHFVDALPRTPAGKIDKRGLRERLAREEASAT
jgi:fatty-acyl-CoA synthase